jgi:hypothetical protein
MGLADEVTGILKQYAAGTAGPPADVNAHFDQVSQAVPASSLADGVAHALRSDQTPALGQVVSNLFSQADGAQKAGMLNQLLSSISSGSAPALATGALASAGLADVVNKGAAVTPDQASRVSPDAVRQLADHAQTGDNSIVDKLSGFYAQHPTLVKSLGVGALALVMSRISNRR